MAADPDCIFCKIIAGDMPATIVDSDEHTVSFMDISPATRGHVLVIPREHHQDLWTIDPDALAACARQAQRIAQRQREVLGCDGANLVNSCGSAAWQTVFHFHIHVIPRYEGDPLRLPWTPEQGDPDEIRAAGEELAR